MTITRTSLNLTDLSWCNRKHPRGPELRFSLTWRGVTDNDKDPAWTIPGFRLVKDHNGEIVLRVPTVPRKGGGSYHTTQISVDLAEWIIATLRAKTKSFSKIGQNYRPEKILELPDDLIPDLPAEVELIDARKRR